MAHPDKALDIRTKKGRYAKFLSFDTPFPAKTIYLPENYLSF